MSSETTRQILYHVTVEHVSYEVGVKIIPLGLELQGGPRMYYYGAEWEVYRNYCDFPRGLLKSYYFQTDKLQTFCFIDLNGQCVDLIYDQHDIAEHRVAISVAMDKYLVGELDFAIDPHDLWSEIMSL